MTDNNNIVQHRYTAINEYLESPLMSAMGDSLGNISPPSSPYNSFRFLKPKRNKGGVTFKKSVLPTLLMLLITGIVIFLIVYMWSYSANNQFTNQSPFVIYDDDELLSIALGSRQRLLEIHNDTLTELNFAIMVLNEVGSWSRAMYNGTQQFNASRLVYLPFLAASVNWCVQQNKDPHCLQMAAGPMIHDFSSIHAGIVMDVITGAPNAQFPAMNDTNFLNWMNDREYVEQFLQSYGLLGNQTIINKIYPSNSGPIPIWAESMAIVKEGPNTIDPLDMAMLMLYIVQGGIVPSGQSYMTDLLSVQTFSEYTSLGFGLPPGTVLHSVMGTSNTDVDEVAHILLPNGRQLVVAAFSNGYANFGNPPYQSSILGMFASDLVNSMGLTNGDPPLIIMTIDSVSSIGGWQSASDRQAYNQTYLYADYVGTSGVSTVTWNFAINVSGLYEVCVWFPAGANHTTKALYVVNTADQSGLTYQFLINQVHYGARWILLDSFYFSEGTSPTVAVSNVDIANNTVVVADTIKITAWPTHNNIPGLSSNFIIEESYDSDE